MPSVELVPLTRELAVAIPQVNGGAAWNGGSAKWDRYLGEHDDGSRLTLVALFRPRRQPIGYGSLLWRSGYAPFADASIPELSDVVVADGYRGSGIGSSLLAALEQQAVTAGHRQIGLGVGLYADYGDAQRLYVRRGYVPDGRGLMVGGTPVRPGDTARIDDDTLLYLVKTLAAALSPWRP